MPLPAEICGQEHNQKLYLMYKLFTDLSLQPMVQTPGESILSMHESASCAKNYIAPQLNNYEMIGTVNSPFMRNPGLNPGPPHIP